MIRYAKDSDLKKIITLWEISFPEEPKFNSYYFSNLFQLEHTLVKESDNKIVAMLQRVPHHLKNFGEVTYIYGACTDPSFRKQGCMSELINFSFSEDKKNNINASILIPAEEALFKFYSKFDFSEAFYINKEVFSDKTNVCNYKLKPCDSSDIAAINALYEEKTSSYQCILRSKDYLKNQINLFSSLESEALCLYDENILVAYAFLWKTPNPCAQEIVCKDENIYKSFASLLLKRYNINEMKLTTIGFNNPFGMIKYHKKDFDSSQKYYMNLMLN